MKRNWMISLEKIDIGKQHKGKRNQKLQKKIVIMIVYILNIIVSALFGGLTSVVVIGVYPFFWPILGPLLGPSGYIITQIQIAKRVRPKQKSKMSSVSYLFSLLGSVASYILGLYYGWAKLPRLGAGALYGVYKNE